MPFKKHTSLIIYLIVFLVIGFVYYQLVSEASFIQDDAYTSLRYVENFVNGKGLVFNHGVRVEGYTNFLWVMLLSLIKLIAKAINYDLDLPKAAQVLSTLFGLAVLLATTILSRKILRKVFDEELLENVFSFLPAIMLLFTTPFIYWSVSGMETSLFVLLTILSIYFYLDKEKQKERNAFVLISVANSFLRPEGTLFFFMLIVFAVIRNIYFSEKHSLFAKIKNSLDTSTQKMILYYSIPIILYTAFRLSYFGYPFPNTFYAKTEFTLEFIERGWRYFISFVSSYAMYGLIILPTMFRMMKRKISYEEIILLAFSFAYTFLIIFIGGDVLPIHRFFLSILPFLFIIFVSSTIQFICEFKFVEKKFILYFIFASVILGYSYFNYERNKPDMMEKRSYESGLVKKMQIYAEFLKNNSVENKNSKEVSVAMSTIGAFSFYSGIKVIDLVGLTDEFTAHNPKEVEGINDELPVLWKERHYNAGYVLRQKPDYIIFPAGAKPSAFAECALFVQDEFRRNYYMQLFYSQELNQLLPVFTRKENVRTDTTKCNVGFVKHYIEAQNLILKMIETKNKKLISLISNELDEVQRKCPSRKSEVYTLKGMAFYHAKNFIIAEKYFNDAAQIDSTNAIARYYLKNILFSQGKTEEASILIGEIIKYSPKALSALN